MKKMLFAGTAILLAAAVNGQSLDKVKTYLTDGKLTEAKAELDKVEASAKGQKNADTYYWKGKLYQAIGKKDQEAGAGFAAYETAFEGYKKCLEIDKNNPMMLLDNNRGIWELYANYFDTGAKIYNEKKYKESIPLFQSAGKVGDYIFEKGWGLSKLDTNLVFFTGLAGINAKDEDVAAANFSKLIDAKLKDKDYESLYPWLLEYYTKKQDKANFDKYLAVSRSIFPAKEEDWFGFEINYTMSQINQDDKKALFAAYQSLSDKNPDNYLLSYNLAVELFNYIYTAEPKNKDAASYVPQLNASLDRAEKAKPESHEVAYLKVRRHLQEIDMIADEIKLIKGTTPADNQKRIAMRNKQKDIAVKGIPDGERAIAIFKAIPSPMKLNDKSSFKQIIDGTQRFYTLTGNKAKVAELDALYDSVDKL